MHLYPGGDQPLPDPPTPVTLMQGSRALRSACCPPCSPTCASTGPDLIVHDSACVWGAVAARELGCRRPRRSPRSRSTGSVPSPTRGSWELLAARGRTAPQPPRLPAVALGAAPSLRHRRGLPLIDLGNIRQPLNLVYTSREFQPAVEDFDQSYRFVGPSIGARPADPSFPVDRLQDPVLYVSLGTVFKRRPAGCCARFATALAPLGGTVVVSTGQTDPAALGPLPANVLVRRFVPQPEVLARAALFVTHGGMNSVNEALYAGVPMLVVPQGADQPLVARRVVELGAGLSLRTEDVDRGRRARPRPASARRPAVPGRRAAPAGRPARGGWLSPRRRRARVLPAAAGAVPSRPPTPRHREG